MSDQVLSADLAATFARHENNPGAMALAQDLRKVLATAGARKIDLKQQAALVAQGRTFVQRVGDAAKYLVAGIVPTTWFGPGQPIAPQADRPDQGTRGRRFDFGVGANIQYQPKSEFGAGVPFHILRALAENYDLLRLVIETRKDQLGAQEWNIIPADSKARVSDFQEEIKEVSEFFENPTPDLQWEEWFRQLAEDDLVCGSMALYPRANRGGGLHSLIPMDVTMIKRLIDPAGMTPDEGPAYQQILKGTPVVDYSREELVYWMRNSRTWRMYGYSPVEQIITTVNIALRRQSSVMEYYTEGNIPDMILGVPDTWNPEQIKEVQDIWDSKLSGQTAQRRRMQLVPEMKGIVMPKDAAIMLKDDADEWFARIVCFAFSIPPNALLKQVNRASGQQMAEAAKEEGLMPMLNWYNRKFTSIIRNVLKKKNVKFAFKTTTEVDPQVKAETNTLYVKSGVISPDEAREEIGREPRGCDELLVYLPTGVTPLKESAEKAKNDILHPPEPPPTSPPNPVVLNPGQALHDPTTGLPVGKPHPAPAKEVGKDAPGKYLGKALSSKRSHTAAAIAKEERRMASAINAILHSAGKRLGAKAGSMLSKATLDEEALMERILKELDIDGISVQIVDMLSPTLRRLFEEAGVKAVAEVAINADGIAAATDQVDGAALDFVEQHGAELVTNIAETTREDLRDTVGEAVADGWSSQKLAKEIEASQAFSQSRSLMIARTELAFAHVQGNVAGWKATGQVAGKRWIVGDGCCDDCQDLDGTIVGMDEDFDYIDGPVDAPPAHPNCRCDIEAVFETADEESATEEE